jgi:hypothetical protein
VQRTGAALLLVLAGGQGHAAMFDAPVPTNAYITFGGLQWAWANPVSADGSYKAAPWEGNPAYTGIDLSYQAQFGWRLPTADELGHAPDAFAFIVDGANVAAALGSVDPISGAMNYSRSTPDVPRPGALACAVPYFSAWATGCNWQNGPGSGSVTSTDWWSPGAAVYAETLVVREIPAVPEPATYGLMVAGLAAVGAVTRKSRKVV